MNINLRNAETRIQNWRYNTFENPNFPLILLQPHKTKNRAHDVVRQFCRWRTFVSHAFAECDIQLHVSLYVNKISIHKKAPWQSISWMEVLIWKRTMPTSIWSLSGLRGALNECVFPAKPWEDKKKKTRPSEERESQILTKYLVSFIIISPSTLSWFRHLNKIDDSRCFPLFHTFCALGSVSNMDLLYLFAIHLAAVCHYLDLLCMLPPPILPSTCSGHLAFSFLVSHSWKMWGFKKQKSQTWNDCDVCYWGGFQRRYNVVSLRSSAWKGCCSPSQTLCWGGCLGKDNH